MEANQYQQQKQVSPETVYMLYFSPIQENVYYKTKVVVDFTPVQNNGKTVGIHPVFNNDGSHTTEGFHLELQKDDVKTSVFGLSTTFSKNVNKEGEINLQIAKPLSERKFCQVCRERYTDYLQHITHPCHHKKIKNNKYSNLIQKMCDKFSQDNSELAFSLKSQLKVENTPVSYSDEMSELHQIPQKKRFIDKCQNPINNSQTKPTLNHDSLFKIVDSYYVN